MLVACRLAGLSALETHYAKVRVRANAEPRVAARPGSDRLVQFGGGKQKIGRR